MTPILYMQSLFFSRKFMANQGWKERRRYEYKYEKGLDAKYFVALGTYMLMPYSISVTQDMLPSPTSKIEPFKAQLN